MSNVNKVYDRLYFVPQLGMFHSEISMLITIEVYMSVLVHYLSKVETHQLAHYYYCILFLTIFKKKNDENIIINIKK